MARRRGAAPDSVPPTPRSSPSKQLLDRDLARIALLELLLREERVEALFRRLRERRRDAGLGISYATVLRWATNTNAMEADAAAHLKLHQREQARDRAAIEEELRATGLALPWLASRVLSAFGAWLSEMDGRDWETGGALGDYHSARLEAALLGLISPIVVLKTFEEIGFPCPTAHLPLLREAGPCLRKRFASCIAAYAESEGEVPPSLAALARDLAPTHDDWLSAFLDARRAEAGQPIVGHFVTTAPIALLPGQPYAEVRAEFERVAAMTMLELGLSSRAPRFDPERPPRSGRIERDVMIWWRLHVLGGPEHSVRRIAAEVHGDPERRRDVRASERRAAALLALGDSV